MFETPLSQAVKARSSAPEAHLTDASRKALEMAKSLRSSAPKEYSLPSSHTLDGFRGVQLDWAFEKVTVLPVQMSRTTK